MAPLAISASTRHSALLPESLPDRLPELLFVLFDECWAVFEAASCVRTHTVTHPRVVRHSIASREQPIARRRRCDAFLGRRRMLLTCLITYLLAYSPPGVSHTRNPISRSGLSALQRSRSSRRVAEDRAEDRSAEDRSAEGRSAEDRSAEDPSA